DGRRWHAGLCPLASLKTIPGRTWSADLKQAANGQRHPLGSTHGGLPGKPDGMGGADAERYCREGRIAEVAAYCETDVVNTYRVWLRYELFRGRLTENGLRASEANLRDYIRSRSDAKPHLASVLVEEQKRALEPDARTGVQSESDGEIFIPDTPGV